MNIKEGYLYHIKDEFFDLVQDKELMTNHGKGKKRPTYLAIIDKNILWFIPLSSKITKYQKIIDKKIKKYGYCNTIIIDKVLGKKSVILLQNAFPTLEKYIDHIHTYKGLEAKISKPLQNKILSNFKSMLKLKEKGINLFFVDIDKIENMVLEELKVKN